MLQIVFTRFSRNIFCDLELQKFQNPTVPSASWLKNASLCNNIQHLPSLEHGTLKLEASFSHLCSAYPRLNDDLGLSARASSFDIASTHKALTLRHSLRYSLDTEHWGSITKIMADMIENSSSDPQMPPTLYFPTGDVVIRAIAKKHQWLLYYSAFSLPHLGTPFTGAC